MASGATAAWAAVAALLQVRVTLASRPPSQLRHGTGASFPGAGQAAPPPPRPPLSGAVVRAPGAVNHPPPGVATVDKEAGRVFRPPSLKRIVEGWPDRRRTLSPFVEPPTCYLLRPAVSTMR